MITPRLMLRFFKRSIQALLILVLLALIFDLHYGGTSLRNWFKDQSLKVFSFLKHSAKKIQGAEIEEWLPESVKEWIGSTPKKTMDDTSTVRDKRVESRAADPTKKLLDLDQLTNEDREKLKKLLEKNEK